MENRKIVHIDMDSFYASVEQRDFPELRGRPIAVGRNEARSVVCTASYEARKFGVKSAMPSIVAQRLCPEIIFKTPRMDVYKEASLQIRDIFYEYTPFVEPLSLDEAYLDVTEDLKNYGSATLIAVEIKNRIKKQLNLTASAGVSFNKFLAKIASDYNKPDGLFVIEPVQAEMFMKKLPIETFYGVGMATAEKMHKVGIANGEDLLKWPEQDLVSIFGKMGRFYYGVIRGNDPREVNPQRERKSYSVENTYERDLYKSFERIAELYKLEQNLFSILKKGGRRGRTITLKVKYNDFTECSKSKTYPKGVLTFADLHEGVTELRKTFPWQEKGIRLLGVGIHSLIDPNETPIVDSQLTLF